jgi:hypothetical protein
MKRTVIINNKLFFIDADLSESDEMFYDRINFIMENKDKYSIEYLVNLSKIYSNVKYKKCVYDEEIMKQVIY